MKSIKLLEDNLIASQSLMSLDTNSQLFSNLLDIYEIALNQIYKEINFLKIEFNKVYNYDVINNITYRIKKPDSIANKMKKKNYELNYKNLVNNIDDIAGLRIICPTKDNIFVVLNLLKSISNINVIKEKDYITTPKESGYSAYHLIVETPVKINNKKILVKVEIQIRTMAMDFWSTNEHKLKYKTKTHLSIVDSNRLKLYAKIINILDDKIMRINQKHNSFKYI